MATEQSQGHASRRGIWLRELIAAGVKMTGGDIIAFAQKYEKVARPIWRPHRGWVFEKVRLPDGAYVQYLVPPHCKRQDIAILQLHGGAYTLGFLPIFQRRADKLAHLGGQVPVLSLDYRLAPAHPFPAALDDALQAIAWLQNTKGIAPESVLAIGESAGAGLSLSLAMKLRDNHLGSLRAMVLMSPWVDLTCRGDSYASRYSMDPMFGRKLPPPDDAQRTSIGDAYAGGQDLRDPYLSPAFGEYHDLPPMLIHVGEYEMLHDDAITVYTKATAAGVTAELKEWPGMFHAFQIADALIPEARTAWNEIGVYIREHLRQPSKNNHSSPA